MNPFAYSRAADIGEAVAEAAAGARVIAGGTNLVDLMKENVERPTRLVDINRLPLADSVVLATAHPHTQALLRVGVGLRPGVSPGVRGGGWVQGRRPRVGGRGLGRSRRTPRRSARR